MELFAQVVRLVDMLTPPMFDLAHTLVLDSAGTIERAPPYQLAGGKP